MFPMLSTPHCPLHHPYHTVSPSIGNYENHGIITLIALEINLFFSCLAHRFRQCVARTTHCSAHQPESKHTFFHSTTTTTQRQNVYDYIVVWGYLNSFNLIILTILKYIAFLVFHPSP